MQNHHLDFTHATPSIFLDRMQGQAPSLSEHREKALVDRLGKEAKAGTLPFFDYAFMPDLNAALPALMGRLPKASHLVVLGIGGSALGARALQKAFAPGQDRPGHKGPWLWIADNIDAVTLESWLASLPPKETLVAVISKSGGTIETMGQYFIVRAWLKEQLNEQWKDHVVMITDPVAGPLRAEVEKEGIASLPVPTHLGGRYSALSAVGLFPAAFMGMNWQALTMGASSVTVPLVKDPASLLQHPSFKLALWAYNLMRHGYDQLIFFSYIPLWNYMGAWFAQLWAESLGKEGKGSMPLPAVGVTDQHSLLQMFLDGPANKACLFLSAPHLYEGPAFADPLPEQWAYLKGQRFGKLLQAEATGTRMALVQKEIPLAHAAMQSTDEAACGKLMGLLMAATVFAGWLLEINPLDQPAVEQGKRLANAQLGAPGYGAEEKNLATFLQAESKATPLNF